MAQAPHGPLGFVGVDPPGAEATGAFVVVGGDLAAAVFALWAAAALE